MGVRIYNLSVLLQIVHLVQMVRCAADIYKYIVVARTAEKKQQDRKECLQTDDNA